MFIQKLIKTINEKIEKAGLRATFQHIPNYFISSFGTKILSLVSLPILTHFLSPEEYGLLNIFGTYTIFISTVFTFNLHSSIVRFYFEKKDQIGSFLFQIVFIQSFSLMVFLFISYLYRESFSLLLNLPKKTIIFLAPIALLIASQNWLIFFLKAKRDSLTIRNYNLIKSHLSFATTIILVYFIIEEKYFGKLFSEIIVLIFSMYYVSKKIIPYLTYKIDYNQLRFMFSYSIQLMPAYLGGIVLAQIDRVMINNYLGNYSTGLYSFAYILASIQSLIATMFFNAWIPDYYNLMNEKKYKKHDENVLSILRIITLTGCSLILFGDLIGKLLSSKDYHDGLYLIPLIVSGVYFSTLTPVYQRNISYSKRTIWTSVIIIFSGLLNVILNAVFLPKYGIIASAFTTLVSYFLQLIFTYIVVRYIIKIHYTKLYKLLYLTFPIILSSIVYYIFIEIDDVLSLQIRLVTFIGCVIILYGLSFYRMLKTINN